MANKDKKIRQLEIKEVIKNNNIRVIRGFYKWGTN